MTNKNRIQRMIDIFAEKGEGEEVTIEEALAAYAGGEDD